MGICDIPPRFGAVVPIAVPNPGAGCVGVVNADSAPNENAGGWVVGIWLLADMFGATTPRAWPGAEATAVPAVNAVAAGLAALNEKPAEGWAPEAGKPSFNPPWLLFAVEPSPENL